MLEVKINMNFDRILEKLKNLDKLGKMSLIRWGILVLSIIFVILCEIEALHLFSQFYYGVLLLLLLFYQL